MNERCSTEPGCITCGDVAAELTVLSVAGDDAVCRDEQGREELVAAELVGTVRPGDRVLVHAGVALERLYAAETDEASEADEAERG
ncbi:MAG: hydrogenase maturation factor [Frankiales bacterium]|nr:hydrogenase maturation factor [Frankiales bacterium]